MVGNLSASTSIYLHSQVYIYACTKNMQKCPTILNFIGPLNIETKYFFILAQYHQPLFIYTHMFIYACTKNMQKCQHAAYYCMFTDNIKFEVGVCVFFLKKVGIGWKGGGSQVLQVQVGMGFVGGGFKIKVGAGTLDETMIGKFIPSGTANNYGSESKN